MDTLVRPLLSGGQQRPNQCGDRYIGVQTCLQGHNTTYPNMAGHLE